MQAMIKQNRSDSTLKAAIAKALKNKTSKERFLMTEENKTPPKANSIRTSKSIWLFYTIISFKNKIS